MNESQLIKIAGVQMDPQFADIPGNLATMLAKIDEAAAQGAKLIAFPECSLTGYCYQNQAEALPHAEPIPGGASIAAIADRCFERDVHVIYGLIEIDPATERIFNALALVGPQGLVGSYRKIHMPCLGLDSFATPGDRPFQVHNAAGVKVGMHICYDGSFPESGRVMTLQGAELLVLPTNWPGHAAIPAAEHMVPCRAHENTVYMMAVNRVGTERGFSFIGRSSICNPQGERMAFASPDQEEIIYAEIDPAVARQKRLVRVPGKHEINRFRDRRPEFYGEILRQSDS